MAIVKKTDIILDRKFDPKSSRHTINGKVQVLHCHHYATLYSQLADDCGMLDGKKLLTECAEDSFFDTLKSYFDENDVTDLSDRISIAEKYYSVCGLGHMKVNCASPDSGEVTLDHSHVDQGWIKKWGERDKPVNFITQGYVAGLFSALYNKPARSYSVSETQSIVSGADCSRFDVVAF